MGRVKDMQDQFRDYYENMLTAEIDSRKTEKGKAPYISCKERRFRFY